MNEAQHDAVKPAPFDTARLDALLEDEGIDVLVATSKHNVQYLLGGYRFFFFDYMCLPCSTGVRPAKRNMSSSTDCGARRSSGA